MKRQAWAVALVVMAACCQVQAAEVVKILVAFSDNSSIPLVFRERPANYLPENVSPAEGVRILEPAALAGDARKAYAIFAIIDICRRTTAAEVSRFEACKSLAPADYDSADRWLKRSSDAGFVDALIEEARRLSSETNEEALAVNQRLWAAGYVYALARLKELTSTREPVLSAAYEMLYVQIHTALGRNPAYPTAKMIADRAREALTARLNTLSVADRERVLAKAKELLATNAGCCFMY